MIKIVTIDTYALILPVKEIYGGAAGYLDDCRSLIVRLEIENGVEGWGEGTQGRPGNTYETLETMEIQRIVAAYAEDGAGAVANAAVALGVAAVAGAIVVSSS